jgi:hypothetical protein
MAIELTTVIARAAPDKVSVERTDDLLAGPLSAGYGFPPRFLTRSARAA